MFEMELRDYTDWEVQSVFKRNDRGKYAYRVVLYLGTARSGRKCILALQRRKKLRMRENSQWASSQTGRLL